MKAYQEAVRELVRQIMNDEQTKILRRAIMRARAVTGER